MRNQIFRRIHHDLDPKDHEVDDRNLEIDKLNAARGVKPDTKASLNQLRNEKAKLDEWREEIVRKEKPDISTVNELLNAKEEIKKLNEETERLRRVIYFSQSQQEGELIEKSIFDTLKVQLNNTKLNENRLTKEKEYYKIRYETLKEELNEYKNQSDQLQDDIQNVTSENLKAQENIQLLKDEKFESEKELNDTKRSLKETQKRYEVLEYHAMEYGEQKATLLEAVRMSNSKKDLMECQLDELRQQNQDMQQELTV